MPGFVDSILSHTLTHLSFAGGGGSGAGGGGGGGSSSSGSGGDGGPFSWVEFTILVAIVIVVLVISRQQFLKRQAKLKADIAAAAVTDSTWEEKKTLVFAHDVYARYQKDWANADLASMKTYMTDYYFGHAQLMMKALEQLHRKNVVEDLKINNVYLNELHDDIDNSKDDFSVSISAFGIDTLIDTASQKNLYRNPTSITEYYHFKRSGDSWLLGSISESTQDVSTQNQSMIDLANRNGYYYSLDWGRLLLPTRGQLFKKGSFLVSDINNHIIGTYKDILVQLYTYNPNPSNGAKSVLIAQATLPRQYGNIVVRRKKGFWQFGIKGLTKVSTEWQDFNKKYDVYASDLEKATSFELLNPLYMEKVEAARFNVNIEVVDSTVYLYTEAKVRNQPFSVENYEEVLGLLNDAFKEMKL